MRFEMGFPLKWIWCYLYVLYVLIALQAAVTVIGNATMCYAAFPIYKSSKSAPAICEVHVSLCQNTRIYELVSAFSEMER